MRPLVVLALAALPLACSDPERSPDLPNVVLISIDALRKDHLGLYGYERDTSPFLDSFAEESIVFDRAYCTAPWTLIAHMTMLTGLFGRQHGVLADGTALAPEIPTLAERLAAAGYHNVALYFPGWIHERFGHLRGFHDVREHERGPELEEHLADALDDRPRDRPFFLFVHVWDVHCQNLGVAGETLYDPPAGYDDLFVPDARERLEGIVASDLWMGRYRYTPEELEAVIALYDGSIRYADAMIERWVERWRAEGILDDTLVMITSDHGEGLAQRKLRLVGHGELWEEGLAVPLIVRPPGGPPNEARGLRRDELASHVDLVPTVLELIDRPRERWLPGHSLFGPIPRDRVHLAEQPPGVVLYRWPHKLVMSQKPRRHPPRAYDLERDPGELDPTLKSEEPELFARIRNELMADLAEREERWGPLPGEAVEGAASTPEEIERLRGVGYFGDEEE